jgi:hypothetical protein
MQPFEWGVNEILVLAERCACNLAWPKALLRDDQVSSLYLEPYAPCIGFVQASTHGGLNRCIRRDMKLNIEKRADIEHQNAILECAFGKMHGCSSLLVPGFLSTSELHDP